jgi:hypothetical protein
MAGPTLNPPVNTEPPTDSATSDGTGLSRADWLSRLRVRHRVAVYFDSRLMCVEAITSAPRSFVTIGRNAKRVNFRRSDGCMCGSKPMGGRFHIEPSP